MIFSSALGIVGLCYSIVILCLYFWKKKANIEGRLTTLLFKILVISLAIIGFIEIGCIWSIVTIDQHPILTEVVCRLHILADIVWTWCCIHHEDEAHNYISDAMDLVDSVMEKVVNAK